MSISLVQQNCHHGGLSLLLSSVPYLQLTVCQGWLAMIKMLIMEGIPTCNFVYPFIQLCNRLTFIVYTCKLVIPIHKFVPSNMQLR